MTTQINDLDIRECLGEYFSDKKYRKAFYNEYGYNQDALEDESAAIRELAYKSLGYTEKAFDDPSHAIRAQAYQTLGYTEKAFDDPAYNIRQTAYETLGYTEKALNDPDPDIATQASLILIRDKLPKGPDIRYVVYHDNLGYFVKNDRYGDPVYSDDIQGAKMYSSLSHAFSLVAPQTGDKLVPVNYNKTITEL